MYTAKPADGIVWITGASSGIGRQVALDLAAQGYRVAVSARRADELEAMAAACSGPGAILPYALDLTDRTAVAATVAQHDRRTGNDCARLPQCRPLRRQPEAAICRRERLEDDGGQRQDGDQRARSAHRAYERAGCGQIVINASLSSYIGLPGAGYYGASKAALLHLAETLRAQLIHAGITVQVVNCGFIETPLTAGAKFPMPFLMKVDQASRRIIAGMHSGRFEITFPKRLSWMLKALRLLPYGLALRLTARAASRSPDKR